VSSGGPLLTAHRARLTLGLVYEAGGGTTTISITASER